MRLSRIRLEQFKQFRRPLEIKDLDSGLNLFTGPNEAGKSTIVAAIRAAFFERHRSSSVDEFRPWDDATASPSVELDFNIGEAVYRLHKSFLVKKRCELVIGAKRIEGAEAEDHLKDLFGFQYAGKGASTEQHWGIPGLLWIQQGRGHEIRAAVEHATGHIRDALRESLGEVASTGGDEVLDVIEEERNKLLTPSTGTPKGLYAEAVDKAKSLGERLAELNESIDNYRQSVDTLETLRREQEADEAERPWEAFREQERAAQEKLDAISTIQLELDSARRRSSELKAQVKILREQLSAFAQQEESVKERGAEVANAGDALETARQRLQDRLAEQGKSDEAYKSAREALRLARQEHSRRQLSSHLADLRERRQTTAELLAKAVKEQESVLRLQAEAVASEIAVRDLEELRKQWRGLRELRVRKDAAATRLRFRLNAGQAINVGNEAVDGVGERLLVDTTTIRIPSVGELEVAPGGTDLGELGRQESALQASHDALLQRLALESLDAAEERHRTHAVQLAEVQAAKAALNALAPKGIEVLRVEQVTHDTQLHQAERALQTLPPLAISEDALPPLSQAEAAEQAARSALDLLGPEVARAQVAMGSAETTFEAATREFNAVQALIDAPDRAERLQSARQALVDANAEDVTLTGKIANLEAQVAQARPEILRQDIERYGRSAVQQENRFNQRKSHIAGLEIELRVKGGEGLEEQRAEIARDLAQMQRREAQLRRRAAALDFLLTLLRNKRKALTRKLQAPLQERLNHYLQLLFPQADLEIDEDLTPGPLTRNSAKGPASEHFDSLSFGAREQMGVIVRLAYADLLKEAGRPTLIILDDALVHSDEERLARMKRVLFDAATRHQILLFSCHPSKWRDLGVSARSLETLRAGT